MVGIKDNENLSVSMANFQNKMYFHQTWKFGPLKPFILFTRGGSLHYL